MKRIVFFFAMILSVGFGSCSEEYDDTALVGRVDDLESRVQRLEELCRQMNTNISSLQTIVSALQNNDYVTAVIPITKEGEVIGYTITFTQSGPVTIYHGEDGVDGTDGVDGAAGRDGYTPLIGLRQDTDGLYYWTLDGEWLTDGQGNKVKAVGEDGEDGEDGQNGQDGENGKDGQDGAPGADGADGITPQLKIVDDYWYISYDNGKTWEEIGRATGMNGKDGQDGEDGLDGRDGDSFFRSVTQDEEYVYFELVDGTLITLPKERPSENITFLDNQVELLCVLNWDTDGDQKLSYKEAAAVKSLGKIFAGTEIIAFNELKYFTGLTEIANFSKCRKLEVITLPESAISILAGAFLGCNNLKRAVLQEGLVSIGAYAFEGCSKLTEITIPQTVEEIGDDVLGGCRSLTAICGKFSSEDSRCLILDGQLKAFAPAGLVKYTVPEGVTKLAGFSSYGNLMQVILPESLVEISRSAFLGCYSLTEITIPQGVEKIGSSAFQSCPSMVRFCCNALTPPLVEKTIGPLFTEQPFIYVPQGCKEAYQAASGWSSWADNILDAVKRAPAANEIWYTSTDGEIVEPYNKEAFGATYQTNSYDEELGYWVITFDAPVTIVGENAFASLSWTNYAESKRLQRILLPEGVTEVGSSAFSGCDTLLSVSLPETLTSIGAAAFNHCSSLVSLIIPEPVSTIGDFAFLDCTSLASLFVKPTTPPVGNSWQMLNGLVGSFGPEIFVPREAEELYQVATGWASVFAADQLVGCEF